MGGGAGKHAKEPAQDVGDDEVFSPIVPEEKREDQGQGMSAHQSVRFEFRAHRPPRTGRRRPPRGGAAPARRSARPRRKN